MRVSGVLLLALAAAACVLAANAVGVTAARRYRTDPGMRVDADNGAAAAPSEHDDTDNANHNTHETAAHGNGGNGGNGGGASAGHAAASVAQKELKDLKYEASDFDENKPVQKHTEKLAHQPWKRPTRPFSKAEAEQVHKATHDPQKTARITEEHRVVAVNSGLYDGNGVTVAEARPNNILAELEAKLSVAGTEVSGGVPCPSSVTPAMFSEALICAQIANKAYDLQAGSSIAAGQTLNIAGRSFQVHVVHMSGQWNIPGLGSLTAPYFILSDAQGIYVAIRGSNSATDWIRNSQFSLEPFNVASTKRGLAHAGFLAIWSRMQEFYNHLSTVTRAHPNKRVFFTGHSLGAAVAQLCAVEFSVLAGHTPYVYSFGSPRVGDDEWRNFARQRIWHFRFKNDHDLVPEVPIWGRVRDGIVSRIIAIRKLYRHAADAAIRLMPQTGQYLCFNEFAAVGRDSIDDHSLTNYIAKIGGI